MMAKILIIMIMIKIERMTPTINIITIVADVVFIFLVIITETSISYFLTTELMNKKVEKSRLEPYWLTGADFLVFLGV